MERWGEMLERWGACTLARDRLPRQLRVARDKGHVRVALLFSRLEEGHRSAREGLEGAEELARCALLEGVEEREERVLRPNLLRAGGGWRMAGWSLN